VMSRVIVPEEPPGGAPPGGHFFAIKRQGLPSELAVRRVLINASCEPCRSKAPHQRTISARK